MSAVLATASPRCIKATHRRRRKVTAGPIVQRYYDPQIGRFLSNDPVGPKGGGNFNRYWYAADNPYRFVDPDGRYVCSKKKTTAEECSQVEASLKLVEAAAKDKNNSRQVRNAMNQVLSFYGKPHTNNGVTISGFGAVKGALAQTDVRSNGTTVKFNPAEMAKEVARANLDSAGKSNFVASVLVHEAGHALNPDKIFGSNDRTYFSQDERHSYIFEARFAQGSGMDPFGLVLPNGQIDYNSVQRQADDAADFRCTQQPCD